LVSRFAPVCANHTKHGLKAACAALFAGDLQEGRQVSPPGERLLLATVTAIDAPASAAAVYA
jgi:hypothetical protein